MPKIAMILLSTIFVLSMYPNIITNSRSTDKQKYLIQNSIEVDGKNNDSAITKNTTKKEDYKIQYRQNDFFQVEKTITENYGGTKETEIFCKRGENIYLVSRNEYTTKNIIPNNFEPNKEHKINKLPFSIN